jgi:hypothetical protein
MAEKRDSKPYERPAFRRVRGFDFAPKRYDDKGNRIAYSRCHGCHGCG